MSSFLVSQEYQHTLCYAPRLDAFVFCDAGYVSFEEFKSGRHAATVGFGARIDVMQSLPLAVGYAFPVYGNYKQSDKSDNYYKHDIQGLFFSLGVCF